MDDALLLTHQGDALGTSHTEPQVHGTAAQLASQQSSLPRQQSWDAHDDRHRDHHHRDRGHHRDHVRNSGHVRISGRGHHRHGHHDHGHGRHHGQHRRGEDSPEEPAYSTADAQAEGSAEVQGGNPRSLGESPDDCTREQFAA